MYLACGIKNISIQQMSTEYLACGIHKLLQAHPKNLVLKISCLQNKKNQAQSKTLLSEATQTFTQPQLYRAPYQHCGQDTREDWGRKKLKSFQEIRQREHKRSHNHNFYSSSSIPTLRTRHERRLWRRPNNDQNKMSSPRTSASPFLLRISL
jgi:hypothetical protein